MNITLNGSTFNGELEGIANLEDILVELSNREFPENHLLGSVILNDNEFSESYPGQSKEIVVNEINNLDVTSISLEKITSAAMKDVTVFLGQIIESVKNTSELFRVADETEANNDFAKLIDSIRAFINFIETTKNTVGWNFNTSIYNDVPIQDKWEKLHNLIDRLHNTQLEGDLILLADLLEYEFVPELSEWINVFNNKSETV